MPYQNNNNRLVPKAVEDRDLKPAATATDKMIRYTVDTSEATKWTNTANALASLGKGMMEMDTLWRYQSQENAIKAIWETEAAGGNKKDWKEVGKRIKGAAMFNPYNDDAFRSLQGNDIKDAAILELMSTPDVEKMNPEKFSNLVSDINQKMMEGFKQAGLSPKDYGSSLVQWDKQVEDFTKKYTLQNKAYTFKQTQTKIASRTAFNLDVALTERPEDMSKGACIKNMLLDSDQSMSDLGWSAETRIGVHFATIQSFLAKHANSINMADLNEALGDFEIDGQKVEEIVPEYHTKLRQLFREAQKAIYEDYSFDLQMKKLEEEISSENAMVEYMNWVKNNPNASVDEEHAKYWELIEKYNVQGSGALKFLNQTNSTKQGILTSRTAQSDPQALEDLEWKLAQGKLTLDDFANAKASGKISGHDAATIWTKWEADKKASINSNDKAVKEINTNFTDEYLTKTKNGKGAYYIKNSDDRNKAQKEALSYYEQYKAAVASGVSPDKAYADYKENVRKLKEGIKIKQEFDTKNKDFIRMLSPKISDAQYSQVNNKADLAAFKRMGVVRYKGVSDKSVTIASKAQPSRTITYAGGKTSVTQRHTGSDIGSTMGALKGRPIYSPMDGQVVYARFTGTAGNVVIVRCDNGKYMKVMHLDNRNLPKEGQVVDRNSVIGIVGSTGNVESKKVGSLHVEFYDKNQQWIAINRFYK